MKKFSIITEKEFLNEIRDWSFSWKKDIDKSISRNLALFGSDKGERGEYFASLISGKSGTGSGGSGFDISDGNKADESKFTSWVQPKVCNTCVINHIKENNLKDDSKTRNSLATKYKKIFFLEKCPSCNESDFKYVRDSRWGIDAESSLKYKDDIENYWLQILEPVEYESSCRRFLYKCFKVSSKNENFIEYLRIQKEDGSKNNCNLIPYSFDFYRFSPIKVIEILIDIENNNIESIFWNLENQNLEKMPLVGKYAPGLTTEEYLSIFENMGIETYDYQKNTKSWTKKDKEITGCNSDLEYFRKRLLNLNIDITPYLNQRKKAHGKDRGLTERHQATI
jgi:hypothetical protein